LEGRKGLYDKERRFTYYKNSEGERFYIVDRRIFQMAFLLIVGVFLLAWVKDGFGNPLLMNFKISCPSNASLTGCENPVYNLLNYRGVVPENIIFMKTLPPGFVFDKNNFWADNFYNFLFVFIVLAVFINHYFYNRKGVKNDKKDK